MKLLKEIFEYLGLLILLINLIVYLKSFRLFKSKAFKLFTYYLLITFIILIISFYLWSNRKDNLYLSHFYFITQFILLSLFYKELFNSLQKKIIVFIIIIVLAALSIQYYLNPLLYNKFNIFEVFVTSFPLVIYSIMHLYNSLNKKGLFMYINAGVLIYLSLSTLIFILGDYLSTTIFRGNTAIKNIWLINKVSYILYLSLILLQWKKSIKQVKDK